MAFEFRQQGVSWWGLQLVAGGGYLPCGKEAGQGLPGMKWPAGAREAHGGAGLCVQAQLASVSACGPAWEPGRLSFVGGE